MPTDNPEHYRQQPEMNHLAGNLQASMPDTVPLKSDQSSDSLKSRIMAAAISILVLLGAILYLVLT